MLVSNLSAFVPEVPSIDISEARWAAAEIAVMIQKLGPDSPVSMVLRQRSEERRVRERV